MKKLLIINGTMGVGKTTVCSKLYKRIERSVWLDGDWCWQMNPFVVNEENKKMVEKNIIFTLRNFLTNSNFECVIFSFSWVMHKKEIVDIILDGIKDLDFELHKVSLVCSQEDLLRRMQKGGRDESNIVESVRRLKMYDDMDTIKIDTTLDIIEDTVDRILKIFAYQ